jgi:hypothetical protein
MATAFEVLEKEVKARETARRHALSLKNLIPEVKVAAYSAMMMDLFCKGQDVYDMVLNGIEMAQRVPEALSMIRGSDFVRNLLQDKAFDMGKDLVRFKHFDSELGPASLKESARITEFSNTLKVGDSIMQAERFLFAAQMFGVLTTYIDVWMNIAGAWAAAKANILEDNSASGVSRGVVLGANDCGPHYAAQFWMFSTPSYPAYHEVEATARNVYNIGLVAGYGTGKGLSPNQKGNLFCYLHANMSKASQKIYSGSFADWTPQKKKSYYIDCSAIFRARCLRTA